MKKKIRIDEFSLKLAAKRGEERGKFECALRILHIWRIGFVDQSEWILKFIFSSSVNLIYYAIHKASRESRKKWRKKKMKIRGKKIKTMNFLTEEEDNVKHFWRLIFNKVSFFCSLIDNYDAFVKSILIRKAESIFLFLFLLFFCVRMGVC